MLQTARMSLNLDLLYIQFGVLFVQMNLLRPGKQSSYSLTSWILILALVLGQSLALVHKHDVDKFSAHHCALCLYAQQLNHSIPTDTLTFPAIVSGFFGEAMLVYSLVSSTSLPFLSRAPPSI